MARTIQRLSNLAIQRKTKPGYYADGAGLYLQVSKSGSKSWVFRYMLAGRSREMGLGSLLAVTLEQARRKAAEQRAIVQDGRDPIAARDREKHVAELEAAKAITFDKCTAEYIKSHRAGWRNSKHAAQWTATLETYASPEIGRLPVQDVDTTLVMKILESMWSEKPETASRLRGRIENILDWAKVRGYRDGENPARWRGHLDKLLPKRSKVAKVKHHPALPYAQIGAFVTELRAREGVAAKALEFIILTAARVSEAVNAEWSEIDFDAGVWTVPESRMKAGREHRVPLSPAAVEILRTMQKQRQSSFVFPGWRVNKALTGGACLVLLDKMGHGDLTVHGFRSTFRDWCAEQTNFPREIAEAALAHTIKDKAEAAYQRGDLLQRRRKLMEAWAAYCAKKPAKVITLHGDEERAAKTA
jgi:integrase